MKKLMLSLATAATVAMSAQAEADPNFYIYLCYGQSNMEGAGQIETIDRTNVPERFQMMAAVNFNNPSRQMYNWYVATPPLVREGTGLGPADWFGRTMCDNLPDDVRVGVIDIAVGGAGIQHLDKDYDTSTLSNEAGWFQNFMNAYGKKPYDRLVACARKAQEVGVIKGILIHQGETNNGSPTWCNDLNKVYTDLLNDLGLNAEDVHIFVGETVRSEMGGACGWHNTVVANIPSVIPTGHVVSAAGLEHKGDGLHFTSHSYRILGTRYATEVLKTMGITDPVINYQDNTGDVPHPNPTEGDFVFDLNQFDPSFFGEGTFDAATGTFVGAQWGCGGWSYPSPIDLSGYQYIVAELQEPQNNHAQLRVWDTPGYFDKSYERDFDNNVLLVGDLNGMMKNLDTGIVPLNTSNIYRVGIWCYGGSPIKIKQVFATNNDPYNAISALSPDEQARYTVYSISGVQRLTEADADQYASLPAGIYVVNGAVTLHK